VITTIRVLEQRAAVASLGEGLNQIDAPAADAPAGVPNDAPWFDVVAIGASAGGVAAVSAVLGALPKEFPAVIALVLHLSREHRSVLTDVLSRLTRLPVQWAMDGARLRRGTVYVAPPDQHLVFRSSDAIGLVQSPPVHFARPSVDLLFESASRVFGPRALAVILSGNGLDGADGVASIHQRGGVVIAQDEQSSEYFSMPREAIASGGVSVVLPLSSIAPALSRLVTLGGVAGIEDVQRGPIKAPGSPRGEASAH